MILREEPEGATEKEGGTDKCPCRPLSAERERSIKR